MVIRSGIRLARNTLQAMGDQTSDLRFAEMWFLPPCGRICDCQSGRSDVRELVLMRTDIVNSFRPNSDTRTVIQLRTLSGGELHPAAQRPTFDYSRSRATMCVEPSVSITSSRLAVFSSLRRRKYLVVWDWKSAETLLVRQPFLYSANGPERASRN